MALSENPHHTSPHHRSSSGCWTCRLRRKKCDEAHPVCSACTSLRLTCNYSNEKPEWMDGGKKQDAMVARLKRDVKRQPHRRRSDQRVLYPHCTQPKVTATNTVTSVSNPFASPADSLGHNSENETAGMAICKSIRDARAFGQADTVLLTFYLDNVLPFLFPFYRPSQLEGGKFWILDLMLSSPVIRPAILCLSSFFLSLARGVAGDQVRETALTQSVEAFEMLRKALRILDDFNIAEHVQGAVRVMAGIMQVQRFEVATSSFNNCETHLNAALALFTQLFDMFSTAVSGPPDLSSFSAIFNRLGPALTISLAEDIRAPSAEQMAFEFSSSLLIFDDIIASTVLQEPPRLYDYHMSLLEGTESTPAPVNLESVLGCQNWVLIHVGQIATLDAWKRQCKRAGSLDVIELVHRATIIRNSLAARLLQLEENPAVSRDASNSHFDLFLADHDQQRGNSTRQTSLVTRVWAHAALIYLFVVVSGWQPASADIRGHVSQIIALLADQGTPPALLGTMVWPFCVAGCLAEPAMRPYLRSMAEALQPTRVFGTVHKALEVMENVWCDRNVGDTASRDLATCFRSQGDFILLV